MLFVSYLLISYDLLMVALMDLNLLKVSCVLTDQFTKQKISDLRGLAGLFVK